MSAETLTPPRNSELPSYWDAVKHFGGRALRALGIQSPALRPRERVLPDRVVSGAQGGLINSVVQTPSLQESPAASSWQRTRNYPGYEVPTPAQQVAAPQVSPNYLMGVPAEATKTQPDINMMQGGLVIGAKEAPVVSDSYRENAPQVHTAGQVIGLTPQESRNMATQISEAPQSGNNAQSHSGLIG